MDVVVTGSRELFYAEEFYRPGRPYAEAEHKARAAVWAELDAVDVELRQQGDRITRIVHGGAKGVDTYCAEWAEMYGVSTKVYKPDWRKHGRGAGFKRNWAMLFGVGGYTLRRQVDGRTRHLKTLQRLVKQVVADKTLRRLCPDLFPALVARREVLLDQTHPERRRVLSEMRLPLPDHALVLAFWDGQSKGTQQCRKAAHALGYRYATTVWKRAALPERPQDKETRINHRTDDGGDPSFASFTEKGCGRW